MWFDMCACMSPHARVSADMAPYEHTKKISTHGKKPDNCAYIFFSKQSQEVLQYGWWTSNHGVSSKIQHLYADETWIIIKRNLTSV
jgi:hypothetical protein